MRIQSGFPNQFGLWLKLSDFSVNRNGHCYLELIEKEPEATRFLPDLVQTIWASAVSHATTLLESTTGQELIRNQILVRADVEFMSSIPSALTSEI